MCYCVTATAVAVFCVGRPVKDLMLVDDVKKRYETTQDPKKQGDMHHCTKPTSMEAAGLKKHHVTSYSADMCKS